jgi:hypothetical protein
MSDMTRELLNKLKISLYWQQTSFQLAEEGSHIVFAYDNQDNLVGQSNEIYHELRYVRLTKRPDPKQSHRGDLI